jgi:hypothetical protein
MARKKTAARKHIKPKDESQGRPNLAPPPGFETHGFASSTGKVISKADAVRAALAAGFEGPQDGTAYIRKEFGIEIAPQHFSAVKSQLKKAAGAPKGKPGRKPKAAIDGYLAPPPKRHSRDGQPDLLAAMEAMKPLVESLGVDTVKRLADLLG